VVHVTTKIPRRPRRPEECTDGPYCVNMFHAHGPREPERLPDGRWKFCRHWVPDGKYKVVGPDPHRHLDDPLYYKDPYVPTPSEGVPPRETNRAERRHPGATPRRRVRR
jgi:hypothetical protein